MQGSTQDEEAALEARFDALLKEYRMILSGTDGCGPGAKNLIRITWNRLDAFAREHPHFRGRVPPCSAGCPPDREGLAYGLCSLDEQEDAQCLIQ